MQRIVQDRARGSKNLSHSLLGDTNSYAHIHANEFSYSVPKPQPTGHVKPANNAAGPSTSFPNLQLELDPEVSRCNSFSISCDRDFQDMHNNIIKNNLVCETKSDTHTALEDSVSLKGPQKPEYSLALIPNIEHTTCPLFESSFNNKRSSSSSSSSTASQMSTFCSSYPWNRDDAFNFGIDTYFHGPQLGFGPQTSFKRVSPMRTSFFSSYSPIRSLCSTYSQANDRVVSHSETMADTKVSQETDEEMFPDLFRVDSLFHSLKKLFQEPIRSFADILQEGEPLSQVCDSTSNLQELSIRPRSGTVRNESGRSHSSSVFLSGLVPEKNSGANAVKRCKFDLFEDSFSKDEIDIVTECILADIHSNSRGSFDPPTLSKSTPFVPLTVSPLQVPAKQSRNQTGGIFQVGKVVNRSENMSIPVKPQLPLAPVTAEPRYRPSVHFTASSLDPPLTKIEAASKPPKPLHVLKSASMTSQKHRGSSHSLLNASHASESSTRSSNVRIKSASHIPSEIKNTKASEDTHKLELRENKIPEKLPVISGSKVKMISVKPNSQPTQTKHVESLSIKDSSEKFPCYLPKWNFSKPTLQKRQPGHLEAHEALFNEEDTIHISLGERNRATEGSRSILHTSKVCPEAADTSKISIGGKTVSTISFATSVKDVSSHYIVDLSPLEGIAFSHRSRRPSQFALNSITCSEGSDNHAPQKNRSFRAGSQASVFEMDALHMDRQQLNNLAYLQPIVPDKVPESSKKTEMKGDQLCHQAISQKNQNTVGSPRVSLPGVSGTKEDAFRLARSTEKVQRPKIHSSFSASGEELTSSSSLALVSLSGALDSTTQEPTHQKTLRMWMSQFKSGGYWWHTPSKHHSSDPENAAHIIQGTQPLARSLSLKAPTMTEAERRRERKERVAALLTHRKKKREGKLQEQQHKAEKQNTIQNLIFFAPSQNVLRAQEVVAPPQEGFTQAPMTASHPPVEDITTAVSGEQIVATNIRKRNGAHLRSMVVLAMQHSNQSEASAQHDGSCDYSQISGKSQKKTNSTVNARIFLKDSHTLQLCSLAEQPNFFRVDEIAQDTGKMEHLKSPTISEAVGRFLGGTNVAILLSSTKGAKSSSLALVQHVLGSLVQLLPPEAVLSWSMCAIKSGHINQLHLIETETRLHSSSELSVGKNPLSDTAPRAVMLKDVLLNGATWVRVKDIDQTCEQLSSAYQQVELHQIGDPVMLVISLVMRQIINDKDNEVVSSLLITDAGVNCEIFDDAMCSLESGPYDLLQNVLRRSTFTVVAFSVSDAENDDALKLLNMQRGLCSIKDCDVRMKSAKTHSWVSQEEISSVGNKSALKKFTIGITTPPTHSKRLKEKHYLESNLDPLSGSCSIAKHENVNHGKNSDAMNSTSNLQHGTDSVQRISLAPNSIGVTISNQKRNFGETNTLVPRTSSCHSDRNSTSIASVRRDTSVPLLNLSGDRRFLAGATSIGPSGGPVWSNSLGNVAQETRFPTSGVKISPACGGTAEKVVNRYDDRSNCQSGSKNVKFKHKVPFFHGSANTTQPALASTNVRTLVILDLNCSELSNITYDDNVVFVTAEDDFEDYEMDEVIEMSEEQDVKHIQSEILQQLCETICQGCNAVLLCGVSRACRVSPLILCSLVRSIFDKLNSDNRRGWSSGLTVSIVDIKGEMVVDLLEPDAQPQKLVVAISPIFGPCVHGVRYESVEDSDGFEQIFGNALAKLSLSEWGKDHRFVFCSIIFKLKDPDRKDVLVCSLVASLAQQNVGLYRSVLECSPLVPRALFHYALGGPCYTVALLGIAGVEKRAKQMLDIQKHLREVKNRPIHPGSILDFINSVREGLVPGLSEKLKQVLSEEERTATTKVMCKVEEMIRDAESLLEDFDHQQPKAYLHENINKSNATTIADTAGRKQPTKPHHSMDLLHRHYPNSKSASTGSKHQHLVHFPEYYGGRICSPIHSLKLAKEEKEPSSSNCIKSLVCFDKRLLGGGLAAVEGNSVLVTTKKGVCRFDADEVIVRDGIDQPIPDSELISQMVQKFVDGCDTGLLAADSSSCAFTLLILHKIVCDVLNSIEEQISKSDFHSLPPPSRAASGSSSRTLKGELQVRMSLIKDEISTDLLSSKAGVSSQKFKMDYSAVFGPLIKGITTHSVNTLEEFDQFFSIAIDNADPALQTDDPGVMVISLILTKYVNESDRDDVFVSTFTATAVFDAVHHYTAVLEHSAGELLELFRKLIGGVSHTIALIGISDEDKETHKFLTVLDMLARIVNHPSEPNSMNKLMQDIELNISKLMEHSPASMTPEERDHITKCVQTLELALHDVKEFRQSRWSQSRLPAFASRV